jgi:hypothetical protein
MNVSFRIVLVVVAWLCWWGNGSISGVVPAERGHIGVRGRRLGQKAPLVLPPQGYTGAAVDQAGPAGDHEASSEATNKTRLAFSQAERAAYIDAEDTFHIRIGGCRPCRRRPM